MPASDEFLTVGTARNVAGGLALLGAGANVYDAFSAVMSSPWSTEKFTNDPEEEAMAREYVMHALIISGIYCAAGSYLIGSPWPVIGGAGVAAYMYWLYNRALKRSQNGGMVAGGKQNDSASPPPPAATQPLDFPGYRAGCVEPWATA